MKSAKYWDFWTPLVPFTELTSAGACRHVLSYPVPLPVRTRTSYLNGPLMNSISVGCWLRKSNEIKVNRIRHARQLSPTENVKCKRGVF